MLSDSILFSNGRFELQFVIDLGDLQTAAMIGAQIDVTDLWRNMKKFGGVDVKM